MEVIKIESVFNAAKSQAWNALTSPEAMKIWYFNIPDFDLEEGKEFRFYEGEEKNFLHVCKILKIENEKLFQHTWTHPGHSKGSSVVTWKIDELDNENVKVTLTHEGIETFADAGAGFTPPNFEMGWNAIVKTNLRNYLYNIKKLVYEVKIEADAESVWNIMWDKKGYTEWTRPFCEGSHFTGEIESGSRIHFLAPNGEGMFSDVFYVQPNKIVIFKHIGNVKDGKELSLDAETEKWTGSFEIYKLNEIEGITTVTAEVDTVGQYVDSMNKTFPSALQELKKISEKTTN